MQLALVRLAGVVGLWLVASLLIGWVQRLVVRVAFWHPVVAGLPAIGRMQVERYGVVGLVGTVVEVVGRVGW